MNTDRPTVTESKPTRDPGRPTPRPDDETASLDVTFDVLRNRRRRLVLRRLRSAEGPTDIGDLAEHVAGVENGIDPAKLNSQQRKRVYISLYQSHLPKLDEAGAVRFDQDRGTISLAEEADSFYRYLDEPAEEPAETDPSPATRYQVAVALAAAVGYGAATAAGSVVAASLVVFGFLTWFVFRTRRA
jgi:DNA-binding transcriptional ArsR family regulator